MAKGDWNTQTGEPQGEEVSKSDFSVAFEQINTDEGTAVAVGTFGPSDIIVRFAVSTLHLVQSFNEGPLYVTSIFSDETPDKRFTAVHSAMSSPKCRCQASRRGPSSTTARVQSSRLPDAIRTRTVQLLQPAIELPHQVGLIRVPVLLVTGLAGHLEVVTGIP
jgi:hypothetical protein